MKLPCELVVSVVLPTARGELAKELVKVHGFTQSNIAKMFGVTGAAISQYIKGTRGGNPLIDNSPFREQFYTCITESAERAANGESVAQILCDICAYAKKIGLVEYINKSSSDSELPKCKECPSPVVNPSQPDSSSSDNTQGTY